MDILDNPFYILKASLYDNRHTIMSLADEQSLIMDAEQINSARLVLTNPRKRLSAEISWLPGVPHDKTFPLIEFTRQNPSKLILPSRLPAISHLNLLVSVFSRMQFINQQDLCLWIS